MKIILLDFEPDDLVLGIRAAQFLMREPGRKDAWLSYGDPPRSKEVYVRRNKSSLTARPCGNVNLHSPQGSEHE